MKDASTNHISEWFIKYNIKFARINLEENIRIGKIEICNNGIKGNIFSDRCIVNFDSISYILFRNGFLFNSILAEIDKNSLANYGINQFYQQEISKLNDFIFTYFDSKNVFSSFLKKDPNKLQVLSIASLVGLNIPYTFITCQKEIFISEKNRRKHPFIAKPIHEATPIYDEFQTYLPFTSIIKPKVIKRKKFAPTLFQEYIEPFCELRIFIFREQIHSIAIFTTILSKENITDWRYSRIKKRYTLFNLPVEIKSKIKKLVGKLGMITGSVDMLLDRQGRYYFLEVNPLGQFNFLGYHGNLNLEKMIAMEIKEKKHEKKKEK